MKIGRKHMTSVKKTEVRTWVTSAAILTETGGLNTRDGRHEGWCHFHIDLDKSTLGRFYSFRTHTTVLSFFHECFTQNSNEIVEFTSTMCLTPS